MPSGLWTALQAVVQGVNPKALAGVGGFVDLGPVAGSTPLNTRLVIDHVLMEVATFVAQLATLRGARSLVADAPDRFFYHLASALEAQGLSKKLVADMCGLALRSYQKRMQRLAESRSDAGRTLWEAVFAHLHERTTATRAELERRFGRDDPQMLGSVLHDLVDGGLVFRTGTGAASVYRSVSEGELALDGGEGAEGLVWLSVYRHGPITWQALLSRHRALDEAALEGIIESLLKDGRVQSPPGERIFSCRELVVGAGERTGAAAAIADHVHAVFTTLAQALAAAPDDPKRAWTGGSTYSFEVATGSAHEAELKALLPRTRAELTALRKATEGGAADGARVVVYCGVTTVPAQVVRAGAHDVGEGDDA